MRHSAWWQHSILLCWVSFMPTTFSAWAQNEVIKVSILTLSITILNLCWPSLILSLTLLLLWGASLCWISLMTISIENVRLSKNASQHKLNMVMLFGFQFFWIFQKLIICCDVILANDNCHTVCILMKFMVGFLSRSWNKNQFLWVVDRQVDLYKFLCSCSNLKIMFWFCQNKSNRNLIHFEGAMVSSVHNN